MWSNAKRKMRTDLRRFYLHLRVKAKISENQSECGQRTICQSESKRKLTLTLVHHKSERQSTIALVIYPPNKFPRALIHECFPARCRVTANVVSRENLESWRRRFFNLSIRLFSIQMQDCVPIPCLPAISDRQIQPRHTRRRRTCTKLCRTAHCFHWASGCTSSQNTIQGRGFDISWSIRGRMILLFRIRVRVCLLQWCIALHNRRARQSRYLE